MNRNLLHDPSNEIVFPWNLPASLDESGTHDPVPEPCSTRIVGDYKERTYSILESRLSLLSTPLDREPEIDDIGALTLTERASIREIIRNMDVRKKFFPKKGVGFSRMTAGYNHFVVTQGLEIEKILLEDAYFEAIMTAITHLTKPGRIHFTLLKKLSNIYKKIPESERTIFKKSLHQAIFAIAIEMHSLRPHTTLREIFHTWQIRFLVEHFGLSREEMSHIEQEVILHWKSM